MASIKPERVSILGNITWLTSANLAVKPVWLLFVLVFCWRYLGTSGYGSFSAALWLAFIGASFTDLGLSTFTVREVARSPHEADVYFTNLLMLTGGLSLFVVVATVGAATQLHDDRSEVLAVGWASIYATALAVTSYVRSYFRAAEKLRYEGISVVVEKVCVVALGTLFLIAWRTPDAVLLGMAVGMCLTLAMNVAFVTRRLARFIPTAVDPAFMVASLRRALPIGFFSIFIVVYLRIGGVLLEVWHGSAAAGEFGAAYRIIEALSLLPTVVTAALLPRLSTQFHVGDEPGFRSLLKRGVLASLAIATACSAVLSLAAKPLLLIINPDPSAVQAGAVLAGLVWIFPLMAVNSLLIVALLAGNDQRYLAFMLGMTTVVSLLLNLVLTRPLGVWGLVATLTLTEILICVLAAVRYRRVSAIRFDSTVPESAS